MFEVLAWIAAGVLTGWIAALFIEDEVPRSSVTFLVSGGIGGGLGGFLAQHYQNTLSEFSIDRIMYAIVGALVIVSIVGFVSSKS